jgi:uncharacterized protein YlbG (UPF0298 family)
LHAHLRQTIGRRSKSFRWVQMTRKALLIYCKIISTAQSLVEFGDVLKQMADVKYALDDNVKQNFLEPLHQLQMKDLKEVMVRQATSSMSCSLFHNPFHISSFL